MNTRVCPSSKINKRSLNQKRQYFFLKIILTILTAFPSIGMGNILTFDFENDVGLSLDGLTSGSYEDFGVSLDVNAIGGKFNRTGSGFGIDTAGADDSDAFDGILSTEGMSFGFD